MAALHCARFAPGGCRLPGQLNSRRAEPPVKIDESRPFLPVNIAVLTVSDTRTEADDRSGATLVERLRQAGHNLAARTIVKDDADAIAAQLEAWIAAPEIDAVIARSEEHTSELQSLMRTLYAVFC